MRLVKLYFKITNEEVELWKEAPLKYYLNLKELGNEAKGNELREKAREFMAAMTFRYG